MKKNTIRHSLLVLALVPCMLAAFTACSNSSSSSSSASTAGSSSANSTTKAAATEAATSSSETSTQAVSDNIYLTLVNKTHKLPDDWENMIELVSDTDIDGDEIQLEKNTYDAVMKLREDLLKEGVDIELDSGYRSVAAQEDLWARFEKQYGLDYCKQYVAVPGYSEHHTALAVDVCLIKDGQVIDDNDEMMKETEIWEKIHAKLADYGFILRYLEGKEDVTGYSYEPWHLRYVGDSTIAHAIMDKGLTLEEYLGQTN